MQYIPQEFLAGWDLFAAPILLLFKGQDGFTSPCRGLVSLILVIGLVIAFPVLLGKELDNPTFTQTQGSSVLQSLVDPNNPVYTLNTRNWTLAVQVVQYMPDFFK